MTTGHSESWFVFGAPLNSSTRSAKTVTDLYLQKMGSMVTGTVNGQFVIAACQEFAGAASIIAGFHHGFFIFAIVLTAFDHPLGLLVIPFDIRMIFVSPGNLRAAVASQWYQHRQRQPLVPRATPQLNRDVARCSPVSPCSSGVSSSARC